MAESPLSPVMNAMDLHSNSTDSSLRQSANSSGDSSQSASTEGVVNLQCPPLLTQAQIKLPLLSSSSSNSEGEDDPPPTVDTGTSPSNGDPVRAASPPPNCAICLGRCKNKCFTDSCKHQFCFKCLCEWSKVKPECPLCKQSFKSIIHNVKSKDQFEEYHIQQPTVQIPHRPFEMSMRSLPMVSENFTLPNWDNSHILSRVGRSFFYRDGGPSGYRHNVALEAENNAIREAENRSVGNQFMYRGELLNMYRQEFPDAIASSVTLSSLWRRYVYDRNLYALPVCDITGHFRESSARFYRDNPAQIHRLMPWVNRDILCLLRNNEADVTTVLNLIRDNLPINNILSPSFRRFLTPFLGAKTAHFIHELYNFARSPYDMIGYDRAVHYSQVNEEVIEFSSASSNEDNGSSSNAATNSTTPSSTTTSSRRHRRRIPHGQLQPTSTIGFDPMGDYRVISRASPNVSMAVSVGDAASTTTTSAAPTSSSNVLTFAIGTTSEGHEVTGMSSIPSGRVGSQSVAINLSTHNRSFSELIIDSDDSELMAAADMLNSAFGPLTAPRDTPDTTTTDSNTTTRPRPTSTVTANIELNTSSDECEFVMERRAPHLRTPEEMVSLNSDSDSDVVFVEEVKNSLAKSSFKTTDEEDNVPGTSKRDVSMATHLQQQMQQHHQQQQQTKHDAQQHYPKDEYNDSNGPSTSQGVRSSLRDRRMLRSYTACGGASDSKFFETNYYTSSDSESEHMKTRKSKRSKRTRRKAAKKPKCTSSRKHPKQHVAEEDVDTSCRKKRKLSKSARSIATRSAASRSESTTISEDDDLDPNNEDAITLKVLKARLAESKLKVAELKRKQTLCALLSDTDSDSEAAIAKARALHESLGPYVCSSPESPSIKDEQADDYNDNGIGDGNYNGASEGNYNVERRDNYNGVGGGNYNGTDGGNYNGTDGGNYNGTDDGNYNGGDNGNYNGGGDDGNYNGGGDDGNYNGADDGNYDDYDEDAANTSMDAGAMGDTNDMNDPCAACEECAAEQNQNLPENDDAQSNCSTEIDMPNEQKSELRIPNIIIKQIKRSTSAQSFTSTSSSSTATATGTSAASGASSGTSSPTAASPSPSSSSSQALSNTTNASSDSSMSASSPYSSNGHTAEASNNYNGEEESTCSQAAGGIPDVAANIAADDESCTHSMSAMQHENYSDNAPTPTFQNDANNAADLPIYSDVTRTSDGGSDIDL